MFCQRDKSSKHHGHGEPEGDKSTQSKATLKKIKSFSSLEKISRSPVKCPASDCLDTVAISSILSHFVSDHAHVNIKPIEDRTRSILEFGENVFTFGENVCLGVLLYAGANNETRPGKIGLSLQNAFLPDNYKSYVNHLPILIMGCKTNLAALSGDEAEVERLQQRNDPNLEIVLLWLTSSETTKPIYATMTVFDQPMNFSHSCVMKMRDLKTPQTPIAILAEGCDHLRLSRADIDGLAANDTNTISMEVLMEEFEEDTD
jgi:Domain of unknown function (DUF4729)